jgi:hypothetical protein
MGKCSMFEVQIVFEAVPGQREVTLYWMLRPRFPAKSSQRGGWGRKISCFGVDRAKAKFRITDPPKSSVDRSTNLSAR